MDNENYEEDLLSNSDENREKNPLQTRDLTVLEKEAFERAKIRHKENIVQPQVVQGKTFKGVAFISKPEKIIFKDFNLGQPVSQTIYLTNVSFTFNSFKLLPMKESIKDFFEIFYRPSGEISAGMSCPITIRFTPQKNEDISDCLPLLAKTGPIMIPLICTCKKSIVRIDSPIVDFGQVIYGEQCTRKIRLENQGALETDIIMKTNRGADLQKEGDTSSYVTSIHEKKEETESISRVASPEKTSNLMQCLTQLKFPRVSKIKEYSTLEIPFIYTPIEKGEFTLPLLVYFENFMYSPPIEIVLKGECVDVPIYVERPIYDFEICFLNHVYRDKLIFYNRSPNPMKIQIIPPKETRNFFEFNPILGYIQGNSNFEIWVKLSTDKDILNYCSKYIKEDLLEIPFKLIGANQLVPVYFTIRARLTVDTLQISPTQLDFGKIYEGCAVRLSLGFKNLSTLPKEILFYPMPSEIRIEPDLIPLHVLPKENLKINLVYRGEEIKKDDTFLTCKIINGNISVQDLRIPYSCEVVKCPLEFSAKKIELPVLQIDEKTNSNITIRNLSSREIILEFFLPDFSICGLRMATMVATIASQKNVDINIEYTSFFKKLGAFTLNELQEKFEKDEKRNFDYKLRLKAEEEEVKKRELEEKIEEEKSGKKVPSKKAGVPEKKADEKTPLNPKTANQKNLTKKQLQELELEMQKQADLEKIKEEEEKLKRLEIEKNFDMAGELLKLGGKFFEFQEGTSKYSQQYIWLIPCYFKFLSNHDSTRSVIYLEVSTVSVEKSLITNKSVIDFGEIAVGFGKSEDLLITNKGDEICYLKMDLLPLFGGFNVINALRTVHPGETKRLIVQFQPNDERYYEETLRIYCLTSTVSVKLKGKGVKPEIKLTPENGLLNAGSVVLGEYSEKSFKIQNVSNFGFDVKLKSQNKGIQNLNRSDVFSFIPSEFPIQSHEEIDVKVIFKPDRVSEKFHHSIIIDVPNQKTERVLFLYGSCYPRQAFIRYFQPYLSIPNEEELIKNLETPFEILKLKDEETIFSPARNKILLEFSKQKDKTDNRETCFSRKILVGNCKLLDPKAEKNSNYEITMPKDDKLGYFSCDNLKGTVGGNQEIVINLSFKPPQLDSFIENIEALQGIGQWIEQKAELKLSGGFIKAGANDLWTFEIILKAYINQI